MVFHMMDSRAQFLPGEKPGKLLLHTSSLPPVAETVKHVAEIGLVAERIRHLSPKVRARILVDGDVIHIFQGDSSLREAAANRFGGESCPMLDAAKALFLYGGHQ